MSARGVWTLARRSFVRSWEGEGLHRAVLPRRSGAWQIQPAQCASRRCVHSSLPRSAPKNSDEDDFEPTADDIFAEAEKWNGESIDSYASSDRDHQPPEHQLKWDNWRAKYRRAPPTDRDFGWDARRRRELIPDFRGTTAERPLETVRTDTLRIENFPRKWSKRQAVQFVEDRLQATVPNMSPPELVAVEDTRGFKHCVFRFGSMKEADAARTSLSKHNPEGHRMLDVYFDRKRVHSPGGRATGEDVKSETSDYSDPKLNTIRIVGLTDAMSMRKIRSLFTYRTMPLPHPVHYFLYRRAPLPNGQDSVMAVAVYAPGTDVKPHLKEMKRLFRDKDVHIAAHQPFTKRTPTRPGARIVLTDYPQLTSLFDFFMAFSHVAPVEYVRFSGGPSTKCFTYIDFADEADAMTAATYHNRLMGKHRIWAHRVSGVTHVDDEVAEAKAAAAAKMAGLVDLPDPSSDPLSGEQTLMELHP